MILPHKGAITFRYGATLYYRKPDGTRQTTGPRAPKLKPYQKDIVGSNMINIELPILAGR